MGNTCKYTRFSYLTSCGDGTNLHQVLWRHPFHKAKWLIHANYAMKNFGTTLIKNDCITLLEYKKIQNQLEDQYDLLILSELYSSHFGQNIICSKIAFNTPKFGSNL